MAKNEDGFDPSLRLGSGQAVGSGQAKLTNRERWLAKYTALREHGEDHGHLTDRHSHNSTTGGSTRRRNGKRES